MAADVTPARVVAALDAEIIGCRACPRLVEWREQVAREKRAAFRTETYWGRPVPGFGDVRARILLLGLAPAAHGANRTGRVFTGDRSGDFLFAALHRVGLANRAESIRAGDGLRLRDARVTAAVRCAPPGNAPAAEERDACRPFLLREMAALRRLRTARSARGVPPESAEHVHRSAHADDARRRAAAGPGARRGQVTSARVSPTA